MNVWNVQSADNNNKYHITQLDKKTSTSGTMKISFTNNCSDKSEPNKMGSLSLCDISDSFLTDIVHKLNIPDNILLTPKRNFGKYTTNVKKPMGKTDENTKEYKTEFDSTVNSTFANDSFGIQNNTVYCSGTLEFELLETRRRLELLDKKADLVNKFSRVTLLPTAEEENSDDDPLLDLNSKVVRAFSADDSVVEVIKDSFEPSFVKDINFEILKHPNSQQKISAKCENEFEIGMKSSAKSSSSLKKKLYSSPKVSLKKYPAKGKEKLLRLNLDSKMAAVSDDNNSHKTSSLNIQTINKQANSLCDDTKLKASSKFDEKSNESLTIPQLDQTEQQNSLQLQQSKKYIMTSNLKRSNSLQSQRKISSESLKEVPNLSKLQKVVDHLSASSNRKQYKNYGIKKILVNKKPYQILNKIGKGGSSLVYQVYNSETQETLALKIVDLKNVDQSVVEGFRSEINVLQRLHCCQRVVKMYDYEFRNNNKELLIVMEKGDTDLSNVLKSHSQSNHNRLSPHLIKLYWQEMLESVREIHDNNIVHSDLKPVNFILVSGKLKLIDFGIAHTMQSSQTNIYKDTIIGTVDFMAPESFQKRREHDNKVRYNKKVDIWSLGIILYNLVYGVTPFSHLGSDIMKKGLAIVNGEIEYGPINDHLLLDVIKKCLQKDPKKRPTAAELLNHPYLTVESLANNSPKPSKINSISSESNIPTELLSQISSLSPNTLKTFSMFIQTLSKK